MERKLKKLLSIGSSGDPVMFRHVMWDSSISQQMICSAVTNTWIASRRWLEAPTNWKKSSPPYARNPGELIDVLQTEHRSKETLTEALKSIKCTMVVFLGRLYISGYHDELEAIRDICGRVYHRNIIVKFVSDPKAVENLQSKKRSHTSEEKKAFRRTRFQERSVKST